jgi:hypothetical protein
MLYCFVQTVNFNLCLNIHVVIYFNSVACTLQCSNTKMFRLGRESTQQGRLMKMKHRGQSCLMLMMSIYC